VDREANYEIVEALDDIPDELLELMLSDFLMEHGLTEKFLEWIEKWEEANK